MLVEDASAQRGERVTTRARFGTASPVDNGRARTDGGGGDGDGGRAATEGARGPSARARFWIAILAIRHALPRSDARLVPQGERTSSAGRGRTETRARVSAGLVPASRTCRETAVRSSRPSARDGAYTLCTVTARRRGARADPCRGVDGFRARGPRVSYAARKSRVTSCHVSGIRVDVLVRCLGPRSRPRPTRRSGSEPPPRMRSYAPSLTLRAS